MPLVTGLIGQLPPNERLHQHRIQRGRPHCTPALRDPGLISEGGLQRRIEGQPDRQKVLQRVISPTPHGILANPILKVSCPPGDGDQLPMQEVRKIRRGRHSLHTGADAFEGVIRQGIHEPPKAT